MLELFPYLRIVINLSENSDAPLHTARLIAGLLTPGLNSDKGRVVSLTVDVVSSMFALSSK